MLDYAEIGKRIRLYRKRAGLSQEALAERVWISTTHMSHIETGSTKLSLAVLVDLAQTLNVSTDALLFDQCQSKTVMDRSYMLEIIDNCTDDQLACVCALIMSFDSPSRIKSPTVHNSLT